MGHQQQQQHQHTKSLVRIISLRVFILLCAVFISMAKKGAAADLTVESAPPQTDYNNASCWVYTHMKKSGGNTVKSLLSPWINKHGTNKGSLYDGAQWTGGEKMAHEILGHNNTMEWGGFTEGLRPYGGEDRGCKWFTMFRHPISRMVSAFYYCRKRPIDPLCATFVLDANSTDFLTFAKHWGNFGLGQFLVAFVTAEDLVATSHEWYDTSICKSARRGDCNRSAWYKIKLYVESRAVCSGEGEGSACNSTVGSLNEVWMEQFLQPAMELLSDRLRYTAVGILEQFDTTMLLFNAALEVPDFDWVTTFQRTDVASPGKDNNPSREQSIETLHSAWDDPQLRNIIWLDILLYDHAVSVFNKQLGEYGLLS